MDISFYCEKLHGISRAIFVKIIHTSIKVQIIADINGTLPIILRHQSKDNQKAVPKLQRNSPRTQDLQLNG